ncbi:MAG TPA: SulP family inorganic anion transporter [Trebonia sp.]|nr:SulP family inorganic anion transporter [Trebonia sp.]
MSAPRRTRLSGWPVLRGVLPLRRSAVAADVLAGVTLAALAIPPGPRVRQNRGDAGGYRPVRAAPPDGPVCRGRFIAPSRRRRGLGHRSRARRVADPISRGLPPLAPPALGWHDAARMLGPAASMFVIVLAQSAATARTYAARHEEAFSADGDLVGLGAANVAAAFSGAFVVNGSPTQTQAVDSAGGRSQLAQLTTSALVLVVLLFVTAPLAYLPTPALAAVVFLIAVKLIDIGEMRRILSVRRHEFAIALLTAAAVVGLGVEDGIVLAVGVSIIDHVRHSYHPINSVLVKSAAGH